mgnify:CR=1 FL=1
MAGPFTLRKKFVAGLCTVVVVSLLVLLGVRLLGKSARFHYLEREHLALVMRMSNALQLSAAAPQASTLTRESLLKTIGEARAIAAHVDVELFTVEQWAFRLIGFGPVIDLPHKDMVDLDHMRGIIEAGSGPVTPELVKQVQPDMEQVMANSDHFGPMVEEAVEVIKVIVIVVNLLGIAALCASFWLIRQATLKPLEAALQAAQRIQSGDLASPVPVHAQDEMGQLMQALADMKDSLSRVVGDVRQRSQTVAHAMNEVAHGHGDLSHRTEEQASTIQQTASSVVQLTASVQQSVNNAQTADQQASSAAQIATQGGQTVDEVVSSMSQILASSKKISDITSVIDGIAFQTNILALNAAVEAARAGEQGRGFAVVAGEVRALAQRSAAAAKEIKTLIGESVARVESGSRLVSDAGQAMTEIVDGVKRVADIVAEIAAAASEQRDGIGQVNTAVVRLDQMTQQNAALVEESAAAAESLKHQAAQLDRKSVV